MLITCKTNQPIVNNLFSVCPDCAIRSSEVVVSSAIQHVFSDADNTILQKSDEFNSFLESTHLEGDDKTAKQTMMSSSAHANHKIGYV